jgi:hypothetical protein
MGSGIIENTTTLLKMQFVVGEKHQRRVEVGCKGEKFTIGTRCHQKLMT